MSRSDKNRTGGSSATRSTFAKKSLGQNFLVDENYIRKIVDALDLTPSDTVIEIGPGRGAITEHLVDSGANVIAIELDRDLVSLLSDQFRSSDNFQVVEADATSVDLTRLIENQKPKTQDQTSNTKLVANLPYYISTAILQHLSTQRNLFERMVLMFQKEVVDRITAQPGNSERGFMTVIVETSFTVERLFDVPANAFRPIPKVTSCVARLSPKQTSIAGEKEFRDLVSKAFLQKRKTILNNLKNEFPNAAEALAKADIDPTRRAESMSLEEWQRLFFTIY